MPEVQRMTYDEFNSALDAQGVPRGHRCFKCPMCGTIQSATDLIRAGCPEDRVGFYIGFSCVGRWTNAGPHKTGTPPGKGCDWTLGGLFKIHKVEVVLPDGKDTIMPQFELATPEEAQAHYTEEAKHGT